MPEPERAFAVREGDEPAGFPDPAAERRFARRLARHPWRLVLPLAPLALCAAVLAFAGFLAGRDAAFERALAAQHELAALVSPASGPFSVTPEGAAALLEGAAAARALVPGESRFDPWLDASAFDAGVERLARAWTEAHHAATRLAESAPAAAALHEDLDRFRSIPARMLVAADELLDLLVEAEDPGGRLAAVGRLMAVTQRSALGAARIRNGGPELLAAVDRFGRDVVFLGELINALRNGDAALGIERVHGSEARALVVRLGREFRGGAPLVREIIERASALATHEAARADLRDALREVHSEQGALAGAWRERAASRPPTAPAAGLLLVLAALGLLVGLRGLRRDAAHGQRLVERRAGQAARVRALGEEVEARRAQRAASARRMQVVGTAVAGVEGGVGETEEALTAHRERLERATVAASAGVGRARDLRTRGYEMVQAVDAAAAGARAARAAAEEAGAALERSESGFREGAARMRHVVESGALVGALGEDLREIGDLARMLSINVAVRASSGGEEGRALAHFADDVQQLADRAGRTGRRMGSLGRALHEAAEGARDALERAAASAVAAGGNDPGATRADPAALAGPHAGGDGPGAAAGEVAGALQRLRATALALVAAMEVQVKHAGLLHHAVGDAGQGLDEVYGALSASADRAKRASSALALEGIESPSAPAVAGFADPVAALPSAPEMQGLFPDDRRGSADPAAAPRSAPAAAGSADPAAAPRSAPAAAGSADPAAAPRSASVAAGSVDPVVVPRSAPAAAGFADPAAAAPSAPGAGRAGRRAGGE